LQKPCAISGSATDACMVGYESAFLRAAILTR
jgi:hypothetical protein